MSPDEILLCFLMMMSGWPPPCCEVGRTAAHIVSCFQLVRAQVHWHICTHLHCYSFFSIEMKKGFQSHIHFTWFQREKPHRQQSGNSCQDDFISGDQWNWRYTGAQTGVSGANMRDWDWSRRITTRNAVPGLSGTWLFMMTSIRERKLRKIELLKLHQRIVGRDCVQRTGTKECQILGTSWRTNTSRLHPDAG